MSFHSQTSLIIKFLNGSKVSSFLFSFSHKPSLTISQISFNFVSTFSHFICFLIFNQAALITHNSNLFKSSLSGNKLSDFSRFSNSNSISLFFFDNSFFSLAHHLHSAGLIDSIHIHLEAKKGFNSK
jgi:hypothetical protein